MTKSDLKMAAWVLGFLILASGVMNCNRPVVQASPCIASASEQCPPADFLKDYDGWHALKEDINRQTAENDLQRKQDTLVGWANRINQQIPPGYTFNESSRKFERRTIPLPPAANSAPSLPARKGEAIPTAPPEKK